MAVVNSELPGSNAGFVQYLSSSVLAFPLHPLCLSLSETRVFGHLVRFISRGRLLQYAEERDPCL